MADTNLIDNEEIIEQNHERGPGWFLKIAYVAIAAFCVYYWFTYQNWKSTYDVQQEKIHTELSK